MLPYKDGEMKKAFRIMSVISLFAFLSGTSVWAYKTEYEDKKLGGAPTEFKLDGVIFYGYEFNDPSQTGPDSVGGSDATGFNVTRAYLNFRTKVKDGFWKGADFRITADGGVAMADLATNVEDDDRVFQMKYAYFSLPVGPGMKLRFGQQHIPSVDGKAGVSLQSLWGHRYIDNAGTEEMGMSSSTDTGIAFILKNPYFGLHLLYGNGEGYHYRNGQNVDIANLVGGGSTLQRVANGNQNADSGRNGVAGSSYGRDLYGMLSVKPTGANKNVQVSINFPFRLQNIDGIHRDEHEYFGVDLNTTETSGIIEQGASWVYVKGEERAIQDRWYGVEVDAKIKSGIFELTAGAGTIYFHDTRGLAYQITQDSLPGTGGTALNWSDKAVLDNNIKYETDVWNATQQAFIHFKVGPIGAFYRIMDGDGFAGRMSRGSRASNPAYQLWILDESNGTSGDLTYQDLQAAFGGTRLDRTNRRTTLARTSFFKQWYGVTYHANKRMQFSAGVFETTDTEGVFGNTVKTNALHRIGNTSGSRTANNGNRSGTSSNAGTNVASQIENSTTFGTRAGLSDSNGRGPGVVPYASLIGDTFVDRQVFIRAQYKW